MIPVAIWHEYHTSVIVVYVSPDSIELARMYIDIMLQLYHSTLVSCNPVHVLA